MSEILFTIRSSDCLDTIRKIQLDDSSWDQDEACIQLANVIAEAPNLDMLRLLNQKGSRKINVKMQMAKGQEKRVSELRDSIRIRDRGYVRVFDLVTNATIC